jgi:predicted nucleic-acid-binding protein
MTGLDTNVLVRYIMQDDAKQSPLANRLLESFSPESPGFVPSSLLWNSPACDCLIACSALAAGCGRTMTFDQSAAKHAGMTLVAGR